MIIKDNEKYEEISNKIYQAQIILERLRKAVKVGTKNIKKLREERELYVER